MTYSDIYTKFMIEYDKADITSSYPSLTDTEIGVLLDKAYLALIAQKITGNNSRKVGFEADSKAIEDIMGLITTSQAYVEVKTLSTINSIASNEYIYSLPEGFLYYINGIRYLNGTRYIVTLVDHESAQQFKVTVNNLPWLKNPVLYLEDNKAHLLIDPSETNPGNLFVTYIKIPTKFSNSSSITFDCSDSTAEELINLAIVFATENTESPRLQTKLSTLSLES